MIESVIRFTAFLCLIVTVAGISASAQVRDSTAYRKLVTTPCCGSWFYPILPGYLSAGYTTRTWVCDSLPSSNDSLDDIARVDLIYLRAMHDAGGDPARTLFVATIAVIEHRNIPLKFGLSIPFTLESDSAFAKRYRNLPDVLFADQLKGNDRDKLQHFFASAWLAYAMDNHSIPDAIGLLIESGEALFVNGSQADPRDVRTNRLGHLFAELLRKCPDGLPSDIIRAWNRYYLGSK